MRGGRQIPEDPALRPKSGKEFERCGSGELHGPTRELLLEVHVGLGEGGAAAGVQTRSLTQFYSVDFSKSRIGVKSAFSTNAQSRFASVVVDGVLGPPRLARHT